MIFLQRPVQSRPEECHYVDLFRRKRTLRSRFANNTMPQDVYPENFTKPLLRRLYLSQENFKSRPEKCYSVLLHLPSGGLIFFFLLYWFVFLYKDLTSKSELIFIEVIKIFRRNVNPSLVSIFMSTVHGYL